MTDNIRNVIKECTVHMVDAMNLWVGPDGKPGKPNWAQKQAAVANFMGSRENLDNLIATVNARLEELPEEQRNVGLVTTRFIRCTVGLLETVRDEDFPLPEQEVGSEDGGECNEEE